MHVVFRHFTCELFELLCNFTCEVLQSKCHFCHTGILPNSGWHVCEMWQEYCFIACVCVWVCVYRLTNVCVSHKWQTQRLDWCNDSSNGKYSSSDCSGAKTINVCIRFIKCNPCTERQHLVLFHHSVLKLGEVLDKLIEKYWTLIFQTNLFTPHQLPAGITVTQETNKKILAQTLSPTEEPNPANHVWVSRLFFHFPSSHQE